MWWKKKRLSKVEIDETGKIIEAYKDKEKLENDFTIRDFIYLLREGRKLIEAMIEFEKENKDKNDN